MIFWYCYLFVTRIVWFSYEKGCLIVRWLWILVNVKNFIKNISVVEVKKEAEMRWEIWERRRREVFIWCCLSSVQRRSYPWRYKYACYHHNYCWSCRWIRRHIRYQKDGRSVGRKLDRGQGETFFQEWFQDDWDV